MPKIIEESGDFRSSDGRRVAFSRYGRPDGRRIVFHSGTPGSRQVGPRTLDLLERHGAQTLILDRPGYDGSERWPDRCIADVVVDVVAMTELHGWDRFAVWGGSGGGPHALACAALLGDRVERCASVVGPAPYTAEGLDWFDGMAPGNVEEFSRALEGDRACRPLVERLSREAIAAVGAEELPISADYALPESDQAALRARLADPGYRDRIVAAFSAVDGWVDDCIAMTRPWGFDLSAIDVPVAVWFGSGDALCPLAHSEWLVANVPGAERHALPGGHIVDDDALDAIYAWLLDER